MVAPSKLFVNFLLCLLNEALRYFSSNRPVRPRRAVGAEVNAEFGRNLHFKLFNNAFGSRYEQPVRMARHLLSPPNVSMRGRNENNFT